jgi:hypothetical protein
MAKPEKVIRVLNNSGVRFVVMGTHAIVGYRKEIRATQDVDVLVRKSDHSRAVAAIAKAFPKLRMQDFPVVTRFVDPVTDLPSVDLMKPADELYRLVFKNTVLVDEEYRIPTLEMALASKFAAMISPNRIAAKKLTDANDFITMVHYNFDVLDRRKLKRLGDVVYRGGGEEVLRLVDDAKTGKMLEI